MSQSNMFSEGDVTKVYFSDDQQDWRKIQHQWWREQMKGQDTD